MFKRLGMLFIVFICGYLLIEWIAITHPFVLSEFFISFIVNPLKFFAASTAFFIGVLCNGKLIRELIHKLGKAWKKHIQGGVQLFLECIGLFIVFIFLFQLGWVHTLVFFSLSMLYGMISVEL
ncbi:hypothetical protein ACIQXV_05085 [Neobacillus sp. NPDC097160]|uniref:hypothetical protein n=1 Tax=Neobacillus sp. NPDC097160 TaxID=3364298 RepID=UPI0038106057